MPARTRILRALVVTAALALVAPATAAAACADDVIQDWFDNGRVDRTYPIHCYNEALRSLPEDMQSYSSAPDDIARARAAALRERDDGSRDDGSSDGRSSSSAGGTGTSGGSTTGGEGSAEPPTRADEPTSPRASGKKASARKKSRKRKNVDEDDLGAVSAPPNGVFHEALERVGPDDARSVPLPLLVLAGIALLLAVGAASSVVARRVRASKPRRDAA